MVCCRLLRCMAVAQHKRQARCKRAGAARRQHRQQRRVGACQAGECWVEAEGHACQGRHAQAHAGHCGCSGGLAGAAATAAEEREAHTLAMKQSQRLQCSLQMQMDAAMPMQQAAQCMCTVLLRLRTCDLSGEGCSSAATAASGPPPTSASYRAGTMSARDGVYCSPCTYCRWYAGKNARRAARLCTVRRSCTREGGGVRAQWWCACAGAAGSRRQRRQAGASQQRQRQQAQARSGCAMPTHCRRSRQQRVSSPAGPAQRLLPAGT